MENEFIASLFNPDIYRKTSIDNTERQRILVVDDELSIRQLLADCLSDDFEILEASNGIEALSMTDMGSPELILLDLVMAGMDGFQVLQKIRENSNIPVVMLSARIDPTDKVQSLKLGADDYVTKPFVIEELKARINAVLRRNK